MVYAANINFIYYSFYYLFPRLCLRFEVYMLHFIAEHS